MQTPSQSAYAPSAPPSRSAARSSTTTERTAAPARDPSLFDEQYDAGTFYRVDSAAANPVPAAHVTAEPKVPRRLQRRAGRFDSTIEDVAPPPQPAVEPHPHTLPPRRQWSQSMLEIARQLARLDFKGTPLSELPPEIVYVEPELPAPPPTPVVPAEQNVVEEEIAAEIELECPPQALAELWSMNAIIMQSSLVELADAETWLAQPVAPSVICHENIANGWSAAAEVAKPEAKIEAAIQQSIEAKFKASVVIETPVEEVFNEVEAESIVEEIIEPVVETKAKKKFRIDSAHAPIRGPHTKVAEPVEEIADEFAAEIVSEEPVAEVKPEPVAEKPAEAPTVPKRPYVPLWEVDRLTWPPLCDKLMKDPQGYFATASNKLLSVVRGGLKVLGITGSRRGEGRTTLALCLARAAAQAGIHVALVDADFARPQLATMLGLETAYGWQEAATGKIPLSEAAVKSLADRLTVLPLEVSTSTSKLSLADPRVTATLRATAATFDLVIVDMGPLGTSNEPLFPVGENCPLDAAVVVRDVRYSLVNESRSAGDRLYDAGIEAVGIAENFVTQPELAFL
ncbi:tyrosine-protein kinase family protein [Anatilimnocola floriformis]|uniref:tyrosine-protein kinase family protein n=1 Tax=Anatilimnocola floriformis TaxID=2948575 RepID=UPI0020C26BEA|nr:P-loop NTPase [Anatilimnocola floriformis]